MCASYEKNQRPVLSPVRVRLGHHVVSHGHHGVWQCGFALRL